MDKNQGKKFALVTGGSRGIGRAISIQLAKDYDYHILVNYNSRKDAALETVAEVNKVGGEATPIQFNVSDASSVNAAIEGWQEENNDSVIEVLVNNAGITSDALFMWMKPEDWHSVINTSLGGFFNVTQALVDKLVANKYGRIINIVSLSGVSGTAGQTNYSAAKGAVIAATKALAKEVARRKITVNAIAPGFISSDMTKDLNEKELVKHVPARRFGTAEEVAHLVSFIASKNAGYITGEVININGGVHT